MFRSIWWPTILGVAVVACATPGSQPHDMSAVEHERQAQAHAETAEKHAAQYDPDRPTHEPCKTIIGSALRAGGGGVCWVSVTNPTETHLRQAEEHRRHAADHRAASAALREAEARSCVGISADDRDIGLFEHTEDIASVAPLSARREDPRAGVPTERVVGAVVTFRAIPGMTAEWLQRVVDCHLARNAALGHELPEMPNCPLVPRGVQAQVRSVGNGFAVEVRAGDPATAREVLSRAQRLLPAPVSSAMPTR